MKKHLDNLLLSAKVSLAMAGATASPIATVDAVLPAIILASATATCFSDLPLTVKSGGSCLLAIAVILADLQSGKKLGYTDKIVKAMQKIPGLENANESQILGVLSLGMGASFGIPETVRMVQQGHADTPGIINNIANGIIFRIGDLSAFDASRAQMERWLGKEISFPYKDEKGRTQKTKPISTSALIQQIAYGLGGATVVGFGASRGAPGIEWTGAMIALASGISASRLLSGKLSPAQIEAFDTVFKRHLEPVSRPQELLDRNMLETLPASPSIHVDGQTIQMVINTASDILQYNVKVRQNTRS